MTAPPPPPYLGFRPDLLTGDGRQGAPYPQHQITGQPYPNQPPMNQFPAGQYLPEYPGQQYPAPGMQYPGQQYPAPGMQYPGQQYPAPGMQYPSPGQQTPKPAGAEYPTIPGGPQVQYGDYGAPPLGEPTHVTADKYAGWDSFSDKAIRALFIRKVYLILMVQLLFSLGVIALFVFEKNVKFYVQRNISWYYLSYFIFLGVYIALVCCGNLRRKYPTNMILLSIFTISMSYMLGTISSFHDTDVVLMAVGICAAVCLAVTLFSFHTKFDFTSCGGVLFILVWVLFLFGIISIFTYNRIMTTIYAGCGALLFTLFLAYDTQMLMGGKKHELSPEEHVFAAMQIYLDIAYIFMFLLTIISSGKNS